MSTDRPQLWNEIPSLKKKEYTRNGPPEAPGVDEDAPWHHWMHVTDDADVFDPVEAAIDIRDHVEQLPETSAAFRLPDATEYPPGLIDDRVVELVGAWRVPEPYPNTPNEPQKWVNPGYVHAHSYAEVVTQCECGTPMVRQQDHPDGSVVPAGHNHGDDCPKDYRLRARARLCEKRRAVVERGLLLGHSVRSMQARLGLRRDSLGSEMEELCLNVQDLKETGRQMRARTFVRLLQEHPPDRIGRAYGVSGQNVRRYVNDRTDTTAKYLSEVRRR